MPSIAPSAPVGSGQIGDQANAVPTFAEHSAHTLSQTVAEFEDQVPTIFENPGDLGNQTLVDIQTVGPPNNATCGS